jgi:hypothetical protein
MFIGKQFDPVMGIDTHLIQPPGPVPPVPVPHPFMRSFRLLVQPHLLMVFQEHKLVRLS